VKDFCLVDGVYWCGAVGLRGVIETNYGLGVGMRRSRDVKGGWIDDYHRGDKRQRVWFERRTAKVCDGLSLCPLLPIPH